MPALPRQKKRAEPPTPSSAPEQLDTRVLEGLIGYNAKRAALAIGTTFFERMAPYGLKQADFSVLALLAHNPGATSRQLCTTLDILPPNFVSLIGALDRRGLIERRPHPRDGRAVGLYLTPAGQALAAETEKVVVDMENEIAGRLTARERAALQRLLQKFYLGGKGEGRGGR